ncbi:response regulator [Labilibacter sediminis]|nr:response regulator [Labilibacter sediminis]
MEINELITWLDRKLESFAKKRNIDNEKRYFFKYLVAGGSGALFLMVVMLIVAISLSITIIVQYCTVAIMYSFLIIISGIFFISKIDYLLFFEKLGMLAIIVFYVAQMGGLLTSGGFIFVGLAPVLHTLIFRNYKWMITVFAFFFLSVCALVLFDEQLPGKELITPNQNRFLFVLNLLAMTSYIFIFALYAQNIYKNMERRETLRQKELNESKTRLYTNITHEFRTPLTVILGLADSLINDTSESVHEKVNTISRNGKSLLQLVDQMLNLSKIESGNMEVNSTYGDILPFLRYIFQLQEYYAREKNLKFTFEAGSHSVYMYFDPEKITTIITNLLSNAIKFTHHGGEITMSAAASEKELTIQVKDNGIGIPEEQQKKIFERFYQVDDKDTRKAGGAGVGLALTKELIILLNGSIHLESTPGEMTQFTVKLPVFTAIKKASVVHEYSYEDTANTLGYDFEKEAETREVGREDKPKVLIIEDNQDVVAYLKTCYQNQFIIDIAFDGKQGYEKALETIPDAIISDIMMPEMDGFTLCNKLKEDYRSSHIPIILLTAKADIASRIKGLEQGADAYIVKPFNHQELLVRINKLLELRRKLYERYRSGEPLEKPTSPLIRREDHFFNKVTGHIKQNLHAENFDVHTLCEEMAMSKSQLYRKFKALTDMSAAKYIRKLRMERSRHLLLTTSMSITEICNQVGIKNLPTFSIIFKDEYGYSPREYANHMNGNDKDT